MLMDMPIEEQILRQSLNEAKLKIIDQYKKNSLDCCETEAAPVTANPHFYKICEDFLPKKQEKRNNNMYVSQDVTVTEKDNTAQTRGYFLERVRHIESEKSMEAHKTYGLEGLSRQMSPNELIDRIKSGTFTVDPEYADDESYDVLDSFVWTTAKKDLKGYKAFQAALADLVASTKDAIWAETDFSKLPGLVAAFKATTITVPTVA
jgi:hypothetical protein